MGETRIHPDEAAEPPAEQPSPDPPTPARIRLSLLIVNGNTGVFAEMSPVRRQLLRPFLVRIFLQLMDRPTNHDVPSDARVQQCDTIAEGWWSPPTTYWDPLFRAAYPDDRSGWVASDYDDFIFLNTACMGAQLLTSVTERVFAMGPD